jgi:hypothetical protein
MASIFNVLVVFCFFPLSPSSTTTTMMMTVAFTSTSTTTTRKYAGRQKPWCRASHQEEQQGYEVADDKVVLLPLLEAGLVTVLSEQKEQQERLRKLGIDYTNCNEDEFNNEDNDNSAVIKVKELQDLIENTKTSAEFGVRKVQQEFYDAFSTANYDAMVNIWSDENNDMCSCTHPGMSSLQGRKVLASWKQMFAASHHRVQQHEHNPEGDGQDQLQQITPIRVKVDICGTTAISTCIEETQNGRQLEAINIYRREHGTWKMMNHMASPVYVGR